MQSGESLSRGRRDGMSAPRIHPLIRDSGFIPHGHDPAWIAEIAPADISQSPDA